MQTIPIIEPATAQVFATNFQLTVNSVNADGSERRKPLTTIQERTALLILADSSGEQTFVPLGAVNAARIGQELIRAAAEASNADPDDLETCEVELTLTHTDS